MPMEGHAFFRSSDLIVNCDLDGITPNEMLDTNHNSIRERYVPVCFNQRARKLSVNDHYVLEIPIGSFCFPLDGEVIRSDHTTHVRSKCINLAVVHSTRCLVDLKKRQSKMYHIIKVRKLTF